MLPLDILFMTPNAHDGFGGSGIQMAHLCRHLRSRGWSAAIVFRAAGARDFVSQRLGLSMRELFVDLPTFAIPCRPKVGDLYEILRRTSPNLVFIHAGLFFRFAEAFGSFDGKVILYCGAELEARIQTPELANATRKVVTIVSISERYATDCANAIHPWRPRGTYSSVVVRQGTYYGFDSTEDAYIDRIVGKRNFLLSVGATRPYKQLGDFIKTVARVRRQGATDMGIVVGPLTYAWLDSVRLSHRTEVHSDTTVTVDDVVFVGPSLYTGNWYHRAQCCLCTSSAYEGIPGALREAMLACCPVGSYNIGSVAELLKDGQYGILASVGDFVGLADGVVKLLKDIVRRNEIVSEAHAHALNWYSADRHVKETESLLAALL